MNLTSKLKRNLAAALVAIAAAGYGVPASAGDFTIEIRPGIHAGGHFERDHRRFDRQRGFGRHFAACAPHEAVRKARWLGLRHAGIRRVNHWVIVVAGHHRGHRASIVFARHSPRCNVIDARGI